MTLNEIREELNKQGVIYTIWTRGDVESVFYAPTTERIDKIIEEFNSGYVERIDEEIYDLLGDINYDLESRNES